MLNTNIIYYVAIACAIALVGFIAFHSPGSTGPDSSPSFQGGVPAGGGGLDAASHPHSASNLYSQSSVPSAQSVVSHSDSDHSPWIDGWSEQGEQSDVAAIGHSREDGNPVSDSSNLQSPIDNIQSVSPPSSQGGAGGTDSGSSSGSSGGSGGSSGGDSSDSSSPPSQGGAPAGGGGVNSGGGGQARTDCKAVVVSSCERYLQDDYLVTGRPAAEIFCAKNETESFQIIVCNASGSVLPDIELHVSAFQPQGSAGKMPVVTLYREHYVPVTKPSYGLQSKLGMYPDALIPFIDPYTNQPITSAKYLADHQSVSPKKSQGYWADVKVSAEVPAGKYTCSILITSVDSPVAEIPVTLNVWDFALPAKHAWIAWFYGFYDIDKVYGTTGEGTPQYKQLWARHQEMTFDHGIYPALQEHPQINQSTGAVIFTPEYIASLKAFQVKYGVGFLNVPVCFRKPSDEARLKKYLAAYQAFSAANPWAGQYVYNMDEQYGVGDPENAIRIGGIVNGFSPSIKLMIAGKIYSPAESVADATDIYVVHNTAASKANIQWLLSKNKTVWTYTDKWNLDQNIMEYRVPAWASYSLGIMGIIGWRTILGTTAIDPWVDPVSHRDSKEPRKIFWNGEGVLMYPGNKAGFLGPVASMRLKAFRDSVEDYDYFKLLESKSGKSKAVELTSALAADFANYQTNSESYIAQRKAIAELILNQ